MNKYRIDESTSKLVICLTEAQRKVVAVILPTLTDRLRLGEHGSRTIRLTTEELQQVIQKAKEAYPHARNGMERNSLGHVIEAATTALDQYEADLRVYQLKITLKEIEPPVWRRIQTHNCTLDELHEIIQTVMGWENYHLYQFEIEGIEYGNPELLDEEFDELHLRDSCQTRLNDVLPKDGRPFRFQYVYDFGDYWVHEILFEGCPDPEAEIKYPYCSEGQRACPPEDVGGVYGFAEYLEVMADPDHEEHEGFMKWRGPFDPERFDVDRVNRALGKAFRRRKG